jgi:diacylglycerol O-acyltransferase / wax synthase
MVQPLSALDAAFLYFETERTPLHVAQACVFDPSSAPRGSGFAELRALIESRLDRVPPFHRKVAGLPAGVGRPVWVEDPNFDLDYHLRPASLPSPGGLQELAAFTAGFIEDPLDHSRPLWEMRMLEGLSDGMIAGVTKVHHSAIDGVSGAEITANLLDVEPDPDPQPATALRRDPVPSAWSLARQGASALARAPFGVASGLLQGGIAATRIWRLNRASPVPPPPSPFSAPSTPFNDSVGSRRRVAFARLDLGEVNLVRKAFQATINDVVLAVCSGALRSYLGARGATPEEDLVAAIPMSVRGDEKRGALGNELSAMLTSLATTVDDPGERLAAITVAGRRAKDQSRAIGAGTLAALAGLVPPVVGPGIGRLISALHLLQFPKPLFNVMISNFPGPPFPLYCAGAKLVAPYPLGPLIDGAALNITLQSYLDTLFVGLVGEADAVPDIDCLPGLLCESLDELVKTAGGMVGFGLS